MQYTLIFLMLFVYVLTISNGIFKLDWLGWLGFSFVVGADIFKLLKFFYKLLPLSEGKNNGFLPVFIIDNVFWMNRKHQYLLCFVFY